MSRRFFRPVSRRSRFPEMRMMQVQRALKPFESSWLASQAQDVCGEALDILILELQGRHPDMRVETLRVGGVCGNKIRLQPSATIGKFWSREAAFTAFTLMACDAAA